MVALYRLCSGKRTQQPNSRSPKDTASYWVRRAEYRSWKDARPGGGTWRSRESSLDCLKVEEVCFNKGLVSSLCVLCSAYISLTIYTHNIPRPGQKSEETPGQFLNRPLQEQVTGAQEHTGQAGEFGHRRDHLKRDDTI